MKYVIKVIDELGNVVKELQADNKRQADQIERGLNINLNHERFFTIVEPVGAESP